MWGYYVPTMVAAVVVVLLVYALHGPGSCAFSVAVGKM